MAEVQDLGELTRGVVPNPVGISPVPAPVPGPVKSEEAEPPPPPPAGPPPGGLSAKAPPAVPPDGAAPGSVVDKTPVGEGSPEKPEASSSKPTKPKKEKKEKKHRSKSPQRSRKSKRRSKSGRSRHESPPRRLASPVRPTGSRADESSDDREELKRRKYVPRSPSRPPPPRDYRPVPSGRPLGRRWEGPIPAHRREPPPGQGKHYQKNKGITKRKRRADYNRRRYWRGARR